MGAKRRQDWRQSLLDEAAQYYLPEMEKDVARDLRNAAKRVLTKDEYLAFAEQMNGSFGLLVCKLNMGEHAANGNNGAASSLPRDSPKEMDMELYQRIVNGLRAEHGSANECARALQVSPKRRGLEIPIGMDGCDRAKYESLVGVDLIEFLRRNGIGRAYRMNQAERNIERVARSLYGRQLQAILNEIEDERGDAVIGREAKMTLLNDLYLLSAVEMHVYAQAKHMPYGSKSASRLTTALISNGLPPLCEFYLRQES